MAGESLTSVLTAYGEKPDPRNLDHIAVKEAVFPFARFPGVDTLLGPEMRSTGEVMGLDASYPMAFAKSQLGGGTVLPKSGTVFISVHKDDQDRILPAAKRLSQLGFKLTATGGTGDYLREQGLDVERMKKVLEGRPNIVDAITNGQVQMVLNTTRSSKAVSDSRSLRRAALMNKVPYFTTVAGAVAASEAIETLDAGEMTVKPLQDYFAA